MLQGLSAAVTVATSWKCTNGCWFCSDPHACPTGISINHVWLEQFVDIMLEEFESIVRIQVTGGGESLWCRQMKRIMEKLAQATDDLGLITSGPCNPAMAERLASFSGLLGKIVLSHNPESEESYRRIADALQAPMPPDVKLKTRFSADQSLRFQIEAGHRLMKIVTDAGWVSSADLSPMLDLSSEGISFLDDQFRVLELIPDKVNAAGRAVPRLGAPRIELRATHACPWLNHSTFALHIHPNHTLCYCCHGRARGLEPMNREGLRRLIAQRPERRKEVASALKANYGKLVHHPCDICPLIER